MSRATVAVETCAAVFAARSCARDPSASVRASIRPNASFVVLSKGSCRSRICHLVYSASCGHTMSCGVVRPTPLAARSAVFQLGFGTMNAGGHAPWIKTYYVKVVSNDILLQDSPIANGEFGATSPRPTYKLPRIRP